MPELQFARYDDVEITVVDAELSACTLDQFGTVGLIWTGPEPEQVTAYAFARSRPFRVLRDALTWLLELNCRVWFGPDA